jgi:ubiquinone/menaquinone biosynthesis C-methylase UbiE
MKSSKAYKGLAMEGLIASWYARTTLRDLNRHALMARELVSKIPAGGSVLEIAPGPGYFCLELAKLGDFRITGLDISRSFVQIARKNAKRARVVVDFREGDASDMPFAGGTFDFTFCQAAFKNFAAPVRAISEMYRVLKQNSTAVIVDMRHDATSEEIEQELEGMNVGPFNRAFIRWTFRQMLSKTVYSVEEMQAMIAETPFHAGRVDVKGIGFKVWLEK